MHALGVAALRTIMRWMGSRSAGLLRRFIRVATAAHLALLRVSGGRVGRRLGLTSATILVLTTVGNRTGVQRRVPLLALVDGTDFIVAASHGGLEAAPGWFHNLEARPEAVIEVDGRSIPVLAVAIADDTRATTWARFVCAFPGYADYQSRTTRTIQLLRLRPSGIA
jgi:deazaflavin-dependent oxidoreductase (nitroreductase family)